MALGRLITLYHTIPQQVLFGPIIHKELPETYVCFPEFSVTTLQHKPRIDHVDAVLFKRVWTSHFPFSNQCARVLGVVCDLLSRTSHMNFTSAIVIRIFRLCPRRTVHCQLIPLTNGSYVYIVLRSLTVGILMCFSRTPPPRVQLIFQFSCVRHVPGVDVASASALPVMAGAENYFKGLCQWSC
jgi:hypothetical protein